MNLDPELYENNDVYRSWADHPLIFKVATDHSTPGFRRPQRAAALSALAHFDIEPEKPATIVMPTGTGKTDTIFSLIIYGLFKRTIILVPSDTLRGQVTDRLGSLSKLREIQAIVDEVISPRVHVMQGRDSALDIPAIESANVTVATPATLATLNQEELRATLSHYSHIIFDEAHHVVAATWDRIRSATNGTPTLYFTATPFRMDGQRIDGKIVFNYSLRQAQRDGYFQKIEFHPVREYAEDMADRVIATRAIDLLRSDIETGYDHILMARCKSINRAKEIALIYKDLCKGDLNPVLVHSGRGSDRSGLQRILKRESRVVICVNMLGEGFDLPELKIAAIHDQHQTPAITLQFIGRITRVSGTLGPAKFVANIANQRIDGEMQALYESDADWSAVIRDVSEEKIGREVERQEFEDKFEGETDAERIIALNPHPKTSGIAYRVSAEKWRPGSIVKLRNKGESLELNSISDDKNIVMAVTKQNARLDWAKTSSVMATTWHLYLGYFRPSDDTLFATCTGDETQLRRFVDLIAPSAKRIRDEAVFRILSGIDLIKLQNVGLIRGGREVRFTMHVGSDVNSVMNDLENGTSVKSNIFAVGHTNGERTSAGCSAKGKLWKMDSSAIDEWIKWCDKASEKINDETITTQDILQNVLRSETINGEWPQGIFFADWPDQLMIDTEHRCAVTFESESYSLLELTLGQPLRENPTTLAVPLTSSSQDGAEKEIFKIKIHLTSDSYSYSAPRAKFTSGSKEYDFAEYLENERLRLLCTDGSIIIGNYRIYSPSSLKVKLPESQVISWPWDGVDLSRESMTDPQDVNSVQGYTLSKIKDDYQIIFDDDGSGEAADLVAIRELKHWIEVDFYHCKYCPSGQAPGARVDDVYVVTGQASRSVKWHGRGPALFQRLIDRHGKSISKGRNRIIKGTPEQIDLLRRKARDIEVRLGFVVVQPAVSAGRDLDEILTVLGTSYVYIKDIANTKLRVITSP